MATKNDTAARSFHEGTNSHAYEYLGAHSDGKKTTFRVFAPGAKEVFVVGDFNGWGDDVPMTRATEKGIWEATLDIEFKNGWLYKYKILTDKGEIFKADPFAFFCEKPPKTASAFFESHYKWQDEGWLDFRRDYCADLYSKPLNIYELHLGSWKRHSDGRPYGYREIAAELIPYVKKAGYTHIEFMPVMEHPFDGSWGYQVCGYYAPSARWGDPDDFRVLIDAAHKAGVGVILDWVPAHFPKDEHGLYEFDGGPLYEYKEADRMEHAGWGTRKFDVGRGEVVSFLISNAVFWAKEYHADGIRVDAVSSMLYLDYEKAPGEWKPNKYGDNRCLEAIEFFKKLNSTMRAECPDVMMIAEESTAWKNLTKIGGDGLGFTYKWNMGWMNDTLNYASTDPYFRSGNHEKLTFPIVYSFDEKYILPISHDEVVHGKHSFIDKMPGDYENKFAGARLFAAYRACFPGKKLSFMGEEIGQFREWDYAGQIEWFLLDYETHRKLRDYYADLNHFYLSHPELFELDDTYDGFEWIYADMNDVSVAAFRRRAKDGRTLHIVFNFTPVMRDIFPIEFEKDGKYEEIFNSDAEKYGGSGIVNEGVYETEKNAGGKPTIKINLPPLGCVIFSETRK